MKIFTRDKSFYKSLIFLAIPIVLQNMITYLHSFADSVMVGRLGEYAIGGVYMANQPQVSLQLVVTGFTSAMVIISTQYWGKKDTQSMKYVITTALRFCAILGFIWTSIITIMPERVLSLFTNDRAVIQEAVAYIRIVCWSYVCFCITQTLIASMRSVEQAKVGMYISLVALFVSVFINYTLIFGNFGFPAMGVRGAATATLIARIIEMLLIIAYVRFVDNKLNFRLKDVFKINKTLQMDYIKYGTPVVLGQVVWAINILSQGAIVGRLSAEAISSASITGMLSNMLFMAVLGLSVALGIVTGKTVGQGEYEKMKQYAITAQAIFLLIGLFSGIFIFFFRHIFIQLYNINENTIFIANQFMTVLSISFIGRCYQGACLGGLVKAGGDVSFVFINDTIFVFGVVIPSAVLALYLDRKSVV